jgi:hypothetical protein
VPLAPVGGKVGVAGPNGRSSKGLLPADLAANCQPFGGKLGGHVRLAGRNGRSSKGLLPAKPPAKYRAFGGKLVGATPASCIIALVAKVAGVWGKQRVCVYNSPAQCNPCAACGGRTCVQAVSLAHRPAVAGLATVRSSAPTRSARRKVAASRSRAFAGPRAARPDRLRPSRADWPSGADGSG